MGGWGYGAMVIGTVVVWALVAAAVVALVRTANTGAPAPSTPPPPGPTPRQVLAERYARGEIDDEEYLRRSRVLGTGPQP